MSGTEENPGTQAFMESANHCKENAHLRGQYSKQMAILNALIVDYNKSKGSNINELAQKYMQMFGLVMTESMSSERTNPTDKPMVGYRTPSYSKVFTIDEEGFKMERRGKDAPDSQWFNLEDKKSEDKEKDSPIKILTLQDFFKTFTESIERGIIGPGINKLEEYIQEEDYKIYIPQNPQDQERLETYCGLFENKHVVELVKLVIERIPQDAENLKDAINSINTEKADKRTGYRDNSSR